MLIPTLAVTLVLLSIMLLGTSLIRYEIVARQRGLIDTLARQGDQYLDETGQLMVALVNTVQSFSPADQAVLLTQIRDQYPRFTALYLLDETGRVSVEDTAALALAGLDLSGEPFFRQAQQGSLPYYFSAPFISLTTGQVVVTVAVPRWQGGEFRGMLVGELNLASLQRMVEEVEVGAQGFAFIVDQEGTLVAYPLSSWVQERRNLGNLSLVQEGLAGQQVFRLFYDPLQERWLIGSVRPMAHRWLVVTAQPAAAALQPLLILLVASLLAFGVSLGLFVFFQRRNVRQIVRPITALAHKADALADGQYEFLPTAMAHQFSEILSLTQSFNRMVEAVLERDRWLEQRVAERTRRLTMVATLSERLNAILNPTALLAELTYQLEATFGYYFVSVFLLDRTGANLVLREASGEAGALLKAQGLSIPLYAARSLIARAARTGKVVTVDDVRQTPDWLPHPLLPDTCSEIAVPIIVEDKVVGVLDVEGNEVAAFDASATDLFRSLASQIGVALHNAHLYTEMEQLVEERTAELVVTNEQLRRERDLVNRIMETSPVGIVVMDPERQVVFANAHAEQLLGLTRNGHGPYAYNTPEWRMTAVDGTPLPRARLPLQQVMRTGQPVRDLRHAIVWPSGKRTLLSLNAAPLMDETGQVNGMVATVEDVTDQVRMEEALRVSETLFHSLIESLPQNVYSKDLEGRFVFANQRYCQTEGKPLEAIIGRTDFDLHPPELAEKYRADDRAVLETGRLFETIEEHTPIGGETIYVQVIKTPVYDAEGHITGVLGIFWDITERKRSEMQIARLQQLLQSITDSMPSALITLDPAGRVLIWNPVAEALTGRPASQVQGQIVWEVCPELARYRALFEQVLRERRVLHLHNEQVSTETGLVYRDLSAFPLLTEAVTGVVLRIDDVTRRVQLEEMMLQSAKMASVGGLAAGVAHEINNPLAAMMQSAQILQRDLDVTRPQTRERLDDCGVPPAALAAYLQSRELLEYLDGIRSAGARAAKIVSDLLSFSRKTTAAAEPRDLNELVLGALALAATDYDLKKEYDFRDVEVRRELAPHLPPVVCDGQQIQQVVLNLVRNAAQAMVAKRSQDSAYRPRLTLRTSLQGEWLRLEVDDNGPGLPEAVQARLFEPFFTTKPVGEGTGLGLWLCWSIVVERHGGRIWAEPGREGGTCLVVELPRYSL